VKKKQYVLIPNLITITFAQALELARALSGKTYDQIADEMDLGVETVRRYFTDPTYDPPSKRIPKLCSVLGNTILIEWQAVHAGGYFVPVVAPGQIKKLVILMSELTKEFSDVLREDGEAREDGEYNTGELVDVEKEVKDLLVKGQQIIEFISIQRGK